MTGAPDGFRVLLPDDWVSLDLDPETADASVRQLVDAVVRQDPSMADDQGRIEELLTTLGREATEEGALLCAVRFDTDPQGRPVQVTVGVVLRSVEGSSDPAAVSADLAGEGLDAEIVELAAGPAVRVREVTEDDFLSLAVLVPVPGVESRVASLSLLSPSLSHEEQLTTFFDSLADTFAFTWNEDEEEPG